MAENIIYFGKGSTALEKNVCSALGGWSFLQVLMRSGWSTLLFESSISLLIFYLLVLSFIVRHVLKSSVVLQWLSWFYFYLPF